jgi:tetratricopeptide (TPR) repeat protein
MTDRKVAMISSTACDLPEHREQVRLACERAGFEPREMMEHLTALDTDAVDISLRMVDKADVYIGIFAYRYGYVPDGQDLSITEMEYNRAVETDKARLIFFIHEDHPVTGKDVETGEGAAKLEALKTRIGKQRVAAFFKSPQDLRGHVVEALTALSKKLDVEDTGEPGLSAAAKLHRRTVIPAPPAPYVAHPYTLLQVRNLVGRQTELNWLTDWVTTPASKAFGARLFCFVAIGGMGKSALTWQWFQQIALQEMKPLAGRLWWSFYESDASFENFTIRALCYVSGQNEKAVRALPRPDREAQLLAILDEQPFLLVLDGLERILLAYHRMDASYLADDDYDAQAANYVVGATGLPASAAQSFVGQHRLRRTTDPRAGAFLQKLAQVKASRILVSTRLYPAELQVPTGRPRPGCFAYFLPGLRDESALELWRALDVSGSRSELVPIFRSVEGHPLLVQALASEVATYRPAPGDFSRWRADHPQFEPTTLPLVQSRSHILEHALTGLTGDVREVLNTLVGFRMATTYDTLEALLVGKDKTYPGAQGLDSALAELEDRGLIGWDRAANRYDAHPIVRGVVWQLTDVQEQQAVYSTLEAHFERMATPDWSDVETLEDLTPAIERYHTLVGLGRYDDAEQLFYDKLSDATLYRLAAHRERIEWLERLFPRGVEGLPALTDEGAQAVTLNTLALSYDFSGQPGRAMPLYRSYNEIREQQDNKDDQQIALSNLGDVLCDIGALREAVGINRQALVLNRELEDTFRETDSLRNLGRVIGTTGDPVFSRVALERGQRIEAEQGYAQGEGLAIAYLAERSLWLSDFAQAKALADRARELAGDRRHKRDFIHAALLQGQAALGLGDRERADERLHVALTRARAVNVVVFELPALIAIAALEIQQNNLVGAKARLDDVWDAAARGPYPLYQADAYNVLADLERATGNPQAAMEAATKAYQAAWCDGPPYAYHWGLETARAHLAALDAPEPEMPAFDASAFEPLPEVEINPKDEHWVDPGALD